MTDLEKLLAEVTPDLISALRSGEQADMDGCRVKVSRQACEEGADLIQRLARKVIAAERVCSELRAAMQAKDARIAELEAALAEAKEGWHVEMPNADQLRAENERLRRLVDSAESIFVNCQTSSGVCCCGDNMDGHSDPMACGHIPVDMGDYSAGQWLAALQRKAGE